MITCLVTVSLGKDTRVSDQKDTGRVSREETVSVWPITRWVKAIGIVSATPRSESSHRGGGGGGGTSLSCMEFPLILG